MKPQLIVCYEIFMGVQYYPTCLTCKEFIDIHKCRWIRVAGMSHPPESKEELELISTDQYWAARWLWFMVKHRSHDVYVASDEGPSFWTDIRFDFKEVFPHKT